MSDLILSSDVMNALATLIAQAVDAAIEKRLSPAPVPAPIPAPAPVPAPAPTPAPTHMPTALAQAPTCKGVKLNGDPCGSKAGKNGYCFNHRAQADAGVVAYPPTTAKPKAVTVKEPVHARLGGGSGHVRVDALVTHLRSMKAGDTLDLGGYRLRKIKPLLREAGTLTFTGEHTYTFVDKASGRTYTMTNITETAALAKGITRNRTITLA